MLLTVEEADQPGRKEGRIGAGLKGTMFMSAISEKVFALVGGWRRKKTGPKVNMTNGKMFMATIRPLCNR